MQEFPQFKVVLLNPEFVRVPTIFKVVPLNPEFVRVPAVRSCSVKS
ncbi:hypothetical protein [Leptospira noguchii]|nr:hypothetical protein [Leptospira noguchii]UOG31426.1 hypothetical protein MAL06_05220 [Leptospira noguchii]